MTDFEQASFLILAGVVGVLIAIGLALVKVEPNALRKKSHTNPAMALFRFAAYRWALAAITFVGGVAMAAYGWSVIHRL